MALSLSSSRVVAYRFTYVYVKPPAPVVPAPPPEAGTKPVEPGNVPRPGFLPAPPNPAYPQPPETKPVEPPPPVVENELPDEVEEEVVALPEDSIVLATASFPDEGFPSFKLNEEDADTSGEFKFSRKEVLMHGKGGSIKIKFSRASCENGKGVSGYILVIPKYG